MAEQDTGFLCTQLQEKERPGKGFGERGRVLVSMGKKSSHFWLALGKDEKVRDGRAEGQRHIFS